MKFQEIKNIESKVWKYPFFFFLLFGFLSGIQENRRTVIDGVFW